MLTEVDQERADYLHRIAQAEALEKAGINPYPPEPSLRTHTNAELLDKYELLQGQTVGAVGRMLSKRMHGGIMFIPIEDGSATIQAVLSKTRLGESYPLVRDNFEVGDFIGVIGSLEKTRTGETSVWADQAMMLAKALRVAPHRILDAEIQQRQRYLHTLVDPNVRERFRTRSKIVQYMRNYFINLGCLEVETPILDSTYGGASAKPFTTHHNALDTDFYLRVANELFLKRMTVGGYYEGVFEFSRDFRNEGMDTKHNPEFTQLELYKPFWDYRMMMDMAEDLVEGIAKSLFGTTKLPFTVRAGNGEEKTYMINYTKPWRRLSIYQGLRDKLDIEPTTISDQDLLSIAHGYGVDKPSRGELMLALFEELWEDELIQPTFVMDYPAETSALTKRHRGDPNLTERFELFVGGMETMNCYTELNDPREQRRRFEAEKAKKEAGDQETMPFDEDFILAQEYGMPQQAGIGIGIDRLIMLLTNINHIRQVIYFPSLRPKSLNTSG